MTKRVTKLIVAAVVAGVVACAPAEGRAAEADDSVVEPISLMHRLVMYVPNRVLDVFDVVRLRVRIGPGVAVDVRATQVAAAFAGSYASLYVGLPGPRNRVMPKLPVGVESRSGVQASVADATVTGGVGPDYGPAEIGVGVQALFVGVDIGVDPLEILDLVAGIFFIDLRNDDG